jgi:hypothetical protein
MVSVETAWSSGATGIACDVDIAIKPRPMANADAARIFIDVPLLLMRNQITVLNYAKIVAMELQRPHQRWRCQ